MELAEATCRARRRSLKATPLRLSPDAYALAALVDDEPLLALEQPIWVDYPVGQLVLSKLSHMLAAPRSHRPPGLLIYGDTNNGKTMIARKFRKACNRESDPKAEWNHVPVVLVENPPGADANYLLGMILEQLGAPEPRGGTAGRRLEQVRHLVQKTGLRLLIIDEIHNVLASPVDKRGIYLNMLKHLSNELELPMVLIGTIEAVRAIQTDQQLGNRFEPLHVPRWKLDNGYATFLSNLSYAMRVTGNWRSRGLVSRFHTLSEGLTGESWKLMVGAAQAAVRSQRNEIDEAILSEVGWLRPSERRRGAH